MTGGEEEAPQGQPSGAVERLPGAAQHSAWSPAPWTPTLYTQMLLLHSDSLRNAAKALGKQKINKRSSATSLELFLELSEPPSLRIRSYFPGGIWKT